MKKTPFLTIALLGILLLNSAMSMVSAVPGPWEPDPEGVPGYEHHMGLSFTAADDPILTGVTSLRIDFWLKDSMLIVSITIQNETNILDQRLPQNMIDGINSATSGYVKVETLWDLISVGLPFFASTDANLKTKKLEPEDYPYLDIGIALYSSDFTLAIVKDQQLAIIAMNIPIDQKPGSQQQLEAAANAAIAHINQFINATMSAISVYLTAEPVLNGDVINVIDHLSFQFGDNGPEKKGIAGFPLLIVGIMSTIGIAAIIKKKKVK